MAHWSDHYIGIPHVELDCAELVGKVLREQLGREVHFPRKQEDGLDHRSGLIVANAKDYARKIDAPHDGCGVLMFFRGRRAHMGLYALIDGQGYVLHSDALFGSSVRMQLERVRKVYKVEGFYDWL